MQKKLHRLLKFFLYTLLVLFLVALLSAVAIQTRPFKNWLKDTIVQTANKQLNGELQIERIDGNFFSHVDLSGIFLKVEQDTLLSLPKLQVTYSLPALVGGEINVNSLLIDSLYLKLKQLPDTTWNITALIKSDSIQVEEDTLKNSRPFGWPIKLDDLRLKNAAIRINAADSLIPEKIDNFNIRLAAFYSEERQELQLKEFSLSTKKPALDLKEISFHFQRDEQNVSLKDFTLQTRENALQGLGSYYTRGEKESSGNLQSKPIQLQEFRVFLPDMQIKVQPELSFSYAYQYDSLFANLIIEDKDQKISLKLNASNPFSLMETRNGKKFKYDINIQMLNLNLAHWAGDPKFNYLVNGAIHVKGYGITPLNAELSYRADFKNCFIMQNRIREISLDGRYDRGDMKTAFKADGDFGLISFDADISNILNSAQYKLWVDGNRLDLSAFTANDTFKTDLSVRAEISGRGFEPQKMKGSGQLQFIPSTISGIEIDTLFANLRYDGPQFTIDTLHLNSNLARLNLSGILNYAGENHLRLKTELDDLMTLKSFIAADTLHAAGFLSMQISGKMDSLRAVADFNLDSLLFNQYSLEALNGSGSILNLSDTISGQGNVHVVNLDSDAIKLDSVGLQANLTNQNVSIILDISRRDFNAYLKGNYSQDSTSQFLLSKLELNKKDQNW
ncbi:MAG: AsmA family protein, partial [Caldithrix sp.]|nr:AsmA family protein [Caldithrix sp.]